MRAPLLFVFAVLPVCAQDCPQRIAEDFVPMTTSERLVSAAKTVGSPRAFLTVGIRAGIDTAANRQREWGQDAEGYGLRYGSVYAENFIGQVIEQSLGFRLHEDNRYFASGQHGAGRRLGYALSSVVLARHDDGTRAFSYSAVSGAATAAFIVRAWQPRSTTSAGDAAISFGLTMGLRAGLNVVREFTPRFAGWIFR